MNHELKTIRTASDAISKFYNGRYPDMVKNPVLLLNYLYQHSYISRPSYTVVFERKKPPYFIVCCVVDEVRTHGTASSKKIAKSRSAQFMLELIQNSEGKSCNNFVEKLDCNVEISYSQIMTQCGDTLSMERSSEYLPFDFADDIAQPQWDSTEALIPQSLKRTYSCTKEAANAEYSMKTDCKSKKAINCGSTNGEIMSIEDYFDPYYPMRNPSSQSSVSSASSDAENIKPSENLSEMTDNSVKSQSGASKSKSKDNRSKKEAKRAKLSTVSTSYVLDSYFDPFFKLKPPVVSYVDRNISRTCVTNTKVNEVQEEPDLNKSEKASIPDIEVPKAEKTKSPFAILQEKSIKNLKLIPRCTIEKDGEGFKCKLVLDKFSSEGTGQSKKLAKINAAISLLSQLEDRS